MTALERVRGYNVELAQQTDELKKIHAAYNLVPDLCINTIHLDKLRILVEALRDATATHAGTVRETPLTNDIL